MPSFNRPTLTDIRRRVTSDFELELGTQAARAGGTPERGFVEAGSGASHGLYGRLAWIAKNAFPHSAEDDQLKRWAALFGVFQIEAERAEGPVYFFGTNGTVVPAGTTWVRADGVQYITLAEGTVGGGGSVTITCRAVAGGAAGNADTGAAGVLNSPITNLQSYTEVKTPGITGGTDQETTLALRTRLAARLATPPNAGGPGSYIAWAKLVAGVTRAWEFGRVPKLGHVTVLFMRDDDVGAPFPDAPEIAAVEEKILEFAPLHIQGRLHVQAPIDVPLMLTFDELTPNTAEVQASVFAALKAMLLREATPAAEDGVVFYKSHLSAAISAAVGEVDHKLSVPAGDITLADRKSVV